MKMLSWYCLQEHKNYAIYKDVVWIATAWDKNMQCPSALWHSFQLLDNMELFYTKLKMPIGVTKKSISTFIYKVTICDAFVFIETILITI